MPDYCTCGAELPPDARFCHKCGKPQREEMFVPPPEVIPTPVTVLMPPPPVAPSFRNPVAVRVGLFVASIATFLCLALPFGFVVWLPSAGFTSVYLFSRRTGQSLTVRGGARMGWMAGVLSFVILMVMITLMMIAVSTQPGGIAEAFREMAKTRPLPANQLEDGLQMLASPAGQAILYVVTLFFSFTVTSVFCTAGGALGAKVLEKD